MRPVLRAPTRTALVPLLAPLLVVGLAAAPAPSASGPGGQGVPHGSFEDGFDGWTVIPRVTGTGNHAGAGSATVVDLTSAGGDDDVASLALMAQAAGGDVPAGCSVQVSLGTSVVAAGTKLAFETSGTYEQTRWGQAGVFFRARVAVRTEDGRTAETVLIDDGLELTQPCGLGTVGFGIAPAGTLEVDLAAAGIVPGDEVEIEVLWSATTQAGGPCDAALFEGVLYFDRFVFTD